jgi:hypothetical protein
MEQQKEGSDLKRNFNFAYAVMVMHQRALTIPMRNHYGTQALGIPCALALVLMVLWGMPSRDPFKWMWIGMWLICQIHRRIQSVRLAHDGVRIHSQYDGWPFEAIRFGRTERAAKMIVEPIMVGVLGGILYWIYGAYLGMPPYGLPYFLLAGLFTLPFVEMVKKTVGERRSQSMMDARLEQEAIARAFRNRWGDS